MRLEYFQLIDRIVAINLAERTIRTEATVPTESTIFEGHFPTFPVMPGVLLIESMAQTAGWLAIGVTRFQRMPFFVGVKEAKLRNFVSPGQQLALSARMLHEGSGFAVAAAEGAVAGKTVCSAELTFRLMRFPTPDFRTHMDEMAARLRFPMEALANA